MNRRMLFIATLLAVAFGLASANAQTAGSTLATVRLTRGVLADGKSLSAGTYQVRLTGDEPAPALGESAHSERWVEFLKGSSVAGREVATVISNSEIGAVAKEAPPRMGQTRVEMLKGGEYLRVWIAKGGEHYLVNLAIPK